MARKNDSFYFDGFKQSADYACQAAHLLSEVMHHYEPDRLLERFDEMHRIEQAADEVRHGMMDELVTAFITPFDRDDIARLSSVLDDVTDRIEGALHRMYYDNVLEIRPDALDLVDMVERSCGKMAELIGELPRFKRSKTLREQVFFINKISMMNKLREHKVTILTDTRVLGFEAGRGPPVRRGDAPPAHHLH